MILRIDQNSSDPIYVQIRARIIEAIAEGSLQPGDALPSVRKLAADLGINLHTVNKAYAVLRDDGYIVMCADGAGLLQLEQSLRSLALEVKARGGSFEDFVGCVSCVAHEVFDREGK
mgnify:CR=1 FL=1